MRDPSEQGRRKPGARGTSYARLADGQPWLLAGPEYRPGAGSLTTPDLDSAVDEFYERVVLGEEIALSDLLAAARILLRANYDLSDREVADLVEVEPGPEAEALARAVLDAIFGPDPRVRGYVDWVRATLLANGLAATAIPASAINDVLAILMATNRTVPPAHFVDACRAALDRDARELLV